MPIRLILVEDHHASPEGLAARLARHGCDVVGAGASAAEARSLVARLAPRVAVIDAQLSADSGVELTRELTAAAPRCRVVLFAGSDDESLAARCLAAGATGYALRTGDLSELLATIRAAAAGRRRVGPRLASTAFTATVRQPPLSKREREVMSLLAGGLNGEQVAEELVLSAETVKTHVRNAMSKLEASTRVHAVALGLASGEITVPAR